MKLTRRGALRLAGGGFAFVALGSACQTDSTAPRVDQVRIDAGELPAIGAEPFHSEAGRFFLVNDGAPVALYARCTHRSCLVRWEADNDHFHCPCHDSRFDRAGLVINGPAERPLERMDVVPQEDGAIVVRTGERGPGDD